MAHVIRGEVEVESGLGLPRLTTTQRTAYTPPAKGYKVFDIDLDREFGWSGAAWVPAALDSEVQGKVDKAGDTMSGDLDMGGNEVTGLPATPTATGATSVEYVDAQIANVAAGAATSLDDLTDVDTTTTATATGQGLFFDGTNFVNRLPVLADISDFDANAYATGAEGDLAATALQDITGESVGDLSDVDITTVAPTDGDVLVWNNTDGEFQPGAITADDRVLKAGDTMTGNLNLKESQLVFTDTADATVADLFSFTVGDEKALSIRTPNSASLVTVTENVVTGAANVQMSSSDAAGNNVYVNLDGDLVTLATYDQVQEQDTTFVLSPTTGEFNVPVTLPLAAPTDNQHAANKLYVDSSINGKVDRAGDTMTGNLVMDGADLVLDYTTTPAAITFTDGTNTSTITATNDDIVVAAPDSVSIQSAGGTGNFTADQTFAFMRTGNDSDTNGGYISVSSGPTAAAIVSYRNTGGDNLNDMIVDDSGLLFRSGNVNQNGTKVDVLQLQQNLVGIFRPTAFSDTVLLAADPTLDLQAATKQYVDAAAAAGVSDLNDLTDVDVTSSASGHILIHDGTSYKNRTAVKADISDFTETDYVHTTGDETIAGIKTFSNNVIVSGDLTVNGTTTTVNSTNLEVTDNIINLNKDEAGAGVTAGSAGVRIERGSETDVQIIFDEADDTFKAGEVGSERVLATTFQESFVVANWTTGTPNTYTITAATHGLGYSAGQVFMVQVFESSGGTASLTTIDTEVNETTGDITLKTAGSTFDGAVIISK